MPNRGADRVLARLFVTPRMMASRPISNCYPAGETRRPRLGGDRAGGAGTLGRATLGRGTLGGGTAALALIPIILKGERPGNEILAPLSVVILGGLLTSTFLNLVVVPAGYAAIHRLKQHTRTKQAEL